MAAKKWPDKDPDEVLDYGFNWSPRGLRDDVILTVEAEVVEGSVGVDSTYVAPVEGAEAAQGTITWLSGGTAGETCLIVLHVVTRDGRHLDQTIKIKIKDR